MEPESNDSVVVLDVGKTSIRAEYRPSPGSAVPAEGPAPALVGTPATSERVLIGLQEVILGLPGGARDAAAVGVGVAGQLSHPDFTPRAFRLLRGQFPAADLAVTSDLVTAHLGALGGRPGVVLVAGTGAAALGVDEAGGTIVADGIGPLLGDEGSGGWIGRRGLQAALRAEQKRGPATSLHPAVETHFGRRAAQVAGWLAGEANPTRQLASFAPAVLAASSEGDPLARQIAEEAAGRLAEAVAAAAAANPAPTCATVGGLMNDAGFRHEVARAIVSRCSRAKLIEPRGDSLAGALLLCRPGGEPLPVEHLVSRQRSSH